MTTLNPRLPYTDEELQRLYPNNLQLHFVQVLLRHGERSPVSARFGNTGLVAYWPYCNAAKRLSSVAMTKDDLSSWNKLEWRRRMETFGEDDGPVIAASARGDYDGVCQLGELTDKGRETTLELGQRLRHLYVHQLKFMPRLISDADMIYLRTTPMPRALESLQQTFWGMYPLTARTASFPPPTIITRAPAEETLFPNESNCRRFSQLSRAFAHRAAERWNNTEDMDYLNKLIGKWMPADSPRVGVDSHPRLSGIMDTVNATLAHGPETRLPDEFYDVRGRKIIERTACDEWFSGYRESREYRQVGIGGLVGDIVGRMVGSVEQHGFDGILEVGGETGEIGVGRGGESRIKFGLSGCHDTTLAAIMASFGAFDGSQWPPYTSHIALELFRKEDDTVISRNIDQKDSNNATAKRPGLWARLKGTSGEISGSDSITKPGQLQSIARKRLDQYSDEERKILDGYYVRMRYNDRPMTIPGCKAAGNHLEGDESFCTLEAFKRIADKFTPRSWKAACASNIDQPAFPERDEPAGY
jgi:acid phosphatase